MKGIHGGDVWQGAHPACFLDFSANLRPEGPADFVIDAMRTGLDEARYYPQLSMAAAKRGLARYAGVPQANILPTAGGIEAIDLVCQIAPGRICVDRPTFGEYALRARANGRAVAETLGDVRAGDFVFLCNPNNPTGRARTRASVLRLRDAVLQKGGTLVVDEAFIDYCPEHSVRRAVGNGLIVLGSLTKILGVPGVRLGYVCASGETIEKLEEKIAPWPLNSMANAIARVLPEHLSEIAADVSLNKARRARFSGALSRCGAFVYPSASNFLLTKWPKPFPDLSAYGILTRDCRSFGLCARYVRLAVKTDAQNDRLLEALTCAL